MPISRPDAPSGAFAHHSHSYGLSETFRHCAGSRQAEGDSGRSRRTHCHNLSGFDPAAASCRPAFSGPRFRGPARVSLMRFRWWIGILLFLSTVINYIDRQTLSVLAPFLKKEYSWNNSDYAWIVIGFRLAYAVGQTGFGRLLDRVGTRRGLTLAVSWYSCPAMVTSLAIGLLR